MSTPSPDARAVVAAVDRLTTQVRRLVGTRPTRTDDATTTCDASTLGIANRHLGPCVLRDGHDGPVHLGPEGETWATVVAEAHTLADGTEAGFRPALAADDEEQQRRARRDSLHNLLARLERTQLHGDEIDLLRRHAEAEMRDTDTARAVATGNLRHVRMLYADLQTAQAERDAARAELEQAQAALARVRALHADDTALCRTCATPAPCATVRALADAEQPTTG